MGIGNFASGDGKTVNSEGDGWAYFYIDDIKLTEVCPSILLEQHDVSKTICEGTTINLSGEPNADSYNWIGKHTFSKLEARKKGNYTVNSYFDRSIIQTRYKISFEPCECSLNVPSIISQVSNLVVHPAQNVRSFEFYLVDSWGRLVYENPNQDIVLGSTPDVSAPYFWRARLSCITSTDQIIETTIVGKLVIQN